VSSPGSKAAVTPDALSRLRALFGGSHAPRDALDLQLVGRLLLHAAIVGVAAGVVGSLFFVGNEWVQHVLLEGTTGYEPLLAAGEEVLSFKNHPQFRPWLLLIVPGLGALAAGLIAAWFAPETMSGGSDSVIHAFHFKSGEMRRRVPLVKTITALLTLGSGGSGGREGPTMQIGGAIGSNVGRMLRVSERERRVLLVAGAAAGMSAVFRTPLGAALLAVEVLHRDDFESDALVPAVLASVVAYSVFISFFGESTLFAHGRYPFIPAHLPLYAGLAIFISIAAIAFVRAIHGVREIAFKIRAPIWAKPALGGLALGLFATPILLLVAPHVGKEGQGLGILGGGYGAAQIAITGATWLPGGWREVELLFLLGAVKIIATALTVGSGGSAGDFGPSLVIGGLFGGAFGRAAQLLVHDPRVDPGAFALVGMAVFYGGLAHVPLASLVMTCELTGSYDLLVPLMLAEGIAFVVLRRRTLYSAQVPTRRESPAHREELIFDVLRGVPVGEVMVKNRAYTSFRQKERAHDVIGRIADAGWQDVFPVLDDEGALIGTIDADVLRTLAADPQLEAMTLADDLMGPAVAIRESEDLHAALETMLAHNLREVLVVDDGGRIVGLLDEAEIVQTYHGRTLAVPPVR
jgi:CIC family chloride channel protein